MPPVTNTKPRTPPITKHSHTQRRYKGDHSQLGSTNSKFHLKIDHPHNQNSKYPPLCTKENKEKNRGEKEKG